MARLQKEVDTQKKKIDSLETKVEYLEENMVTKKEFDQLQTMVKVSTVTDREK